MTTLTEGKYTGEFLLSEAAGSRSRDAIVVAQTGAAIPSGTLMGKVTAGGKYIPYLDGASDGSQAAKGVLYQTLGAATGDIKAVLIARDAEVVGSRLTGADAAGLADLALIGVVVR